MSHEISVKKITLSKIETYSTLQLNQAGTMMLLENVSIIFCAFKQLQTSRHGINLPVLFADLFFFCSSNQLLQSMLGTLQSVICVLQSMLTKHTAKCGGHAAKHALHAARRGKHAAKHAGHAAKHAKHTAKCGRHAAKHATNTAKCLKHVAKQGTTDAFTDMV